MLSLAITTDIVSQSLLPALHIAHEFHLPAVHLRHIDTRMPHEHTRGAVKEIRLLLQDQNITVSAVHTAFGQDEARKPETYQSEEDLLKRSAEFARELDCTVLLGETFENKLQTRPDWDLLRRNLQKTTAVLENFGVTLSLINSYRGHTRTAEQLAELLREQCEHPRLTACWSPVQDTMAGDQKSEEKLPLLLPKLTHLLIDDAVPVQAAGWRRVFPGQGKARWPAILETLREADATANLCLAAPLETAHLTDELRHKYRSYLHGEPAEALTRAALARMSEWLER